MTEDLTPPPEAVDDARIGVDEWVASEAERREQRTGLSGLIQRGWNAPPPAAKLLVFVGLASTLPFWMNQGNLFAYGIFTLIYALLALGLNVIVGFAGLLDLGYVAYYGIGAYTYALLSSDHYDIHLQAEFSIPIAIFGAAFFGLLLGVTSRRLLAGLLAIVTLFFGRPSSSSWALQIRASPARG